MVENAQPPVLDRCNFSSYCTSTCINSLREQAFFLTEKELRNFRKRRIFPANLCNRCEYQKITVKNPNGKSYVKNCKLSSFLYRNNEWAGLYIPTNKMKERNVKFPPL